MFNIYPLVGKWEALTGEGGFGVCGVDLGIVGGERDWVVQLIVVEYLSEEVK